MLITSSKLANTSRFGWFACTVFVWRLLGNGGALIQSVDGTMGPFCYLHTYISLYYYYCFLMLQCIVAIYHRRYRSFINVDTIWFSKFSWMCWLLWASFDSLMIWTYFLMRVLITLLKKKKVLVTFINFAFLWCINAKVYGLFK